MSVNESEQIRNEEEYDAALAQVWEGMNTELTESESVELEALAERVERYEDETWLEPSITGDQAAVA